MPDGKDCQFMTRTGVNALADIKMPMPAAQVGLPGGEVQDKVGGQRWFGNISSRL
jgi:hypothetical protein